MKLQRSTIILMFGALLMGGAFYYYETLIIPAREAKESFAKKIFKFQKEDVQSLVVKTESKTLRFDRDSESSSPKDLWFMEILEISESPAEETATTQETTTEETEETATNEETANTEDVTDVTTEEITEITEASAAETPETTATNQEPATTEEGRESTESSSDDSQPSGETLDPSREEKMYGNEAYVSFLLEQLASDRSEQTLTVTPEQLKEYDLNPPVATIEITLKNQTTHKLTIGKSEFSGNYIYAQVDPPTLDITTQPVVIVSKNFEYAVDRPLEDWKQPPEILEENPESAEEMSEEDAQNSSESSEETLEEPTETPEASDPPSTSDPETDPVPANQSLDRTEENSANSPETSDKINPEAAEEAADN